MSRYDHENIDFLHLPDPNPSNTHYYTSSGECMLKEKFLKLKDPPTICAKEVQNKQTKITSYFILCDSNNRLFNPKEHDSRKRFKLLWKFRRVKRSTFDFYIKFLRQHYRSFLLQAEREL